VGLYRESRKAVQAAAEAKLGRALEEHERRVLQNASSLMMLDAWGMAVHYATSPEQLAEELRTDTSGERRFQDALPRAIERLEQCLRRPLTAAERSTLEVTQTIESLLELDERLGRATASDVEAVFAWFLQSPR
jgi:hypothetical protein